MNNNIYKFEGDLFFLSNYYSAPVVYEGITYRNNEAAFQANKSVDRSVQMTFSKLSAPEAKKKGRDINLRKDWENVKVQIMKEIVHAKFEQNPLLREKLLQTGDAYLEEGNDWGDRIWGTVDGKGANLLGIILMEERECLRRNFGEDNNIGYNIHKCSR